ncbi:hypothetical protein ACFYZ2_04240 [Streptomyces sviceus]
MHDVPARVGGPHPRAPVHQEVGSGDPLGRACLIVLMGIALFP